MGMERGAQRAMTPEQGMMQRLEQLQSQPLASTGQQRNSSEIETLQKQLTDITVAKIRSSGGASANATPGEVMKDLEDAVSGAFTLNTYDDDGALSDSKVDKQAMYEFMSYVMPQLPPEILGNPQALVATAREWNLRQAATQNAQRGLGLRGTDNPFGPEGLSLKDISKPRPLDWDDVRTPWSKYTNDGTERRSDLGITDWFDHNLNFLSDDTYVRDVGDIGVMDEEDLLRRMNPAEVDSFRRR
jgi:hypothetical protein